jgi:hypothetical protein
MSAKEKGPGVSGAQEVKREPNLAQDSVSANAPKLGAGKYPGYSNLPAKPGVYRCKVWPQTDKRDPQHADYKGVLQLTGSKASVLIWVHSDGTLGLRLEKITNKEASR